MRVSLVGYNVVFTLLYNPSHTNLLYLSENSQRRESSNIKSLTLTFNLYIILILNIVFDCNTITAGQVSFQRKN